VNATLHHGDALAVLRTFPDCSVDSICTDPPYGLAEHKPATIAPR
jgi:DNA modification methylase